MMLFLLLFVGFAECTDFSDSTYRTDTGVLCNKCLPGHFVGAHCTGGTNHTPDCQPCSSGTYQKDRTESQLCVPCTGYCHTDRQEMVKNCTSVSDAVCQCKVGYFQQQEGQDKFVCLSHHDCPVGEGVVRPGDHENNTTCTICQAGFFSDIASKKDPCKQCSTCSEGYREKRPCTSKNDTVCEPDRDDAILGIIMGAVGLIIFIITVVVILIVCARRGKGPRFLKERLSKCKDSESQDDNQIQDEGQRQILIMDEIDQAGGRNRHESVPDSLGYQSGEDADPLPVSMLTSLAQDLISPQWSFFFRTLFANPDIDTELNQVQMDNQNNVKEQIYQMLLRWKQKETISPRDKLIEALNKHKPDLVDKYSKFFPSQSEQNGSAVVENNDETADISETQLLATERTDQHTLESNGVTSNGRSPGSDV